MRAIGRDEGGGSGYGVRLGPNPTIIERYSYLATEACLPHPHLAPSEDMQGDRLGTSQAAPQTVRAARSPTDFLGSLQVHWWPAQTGIGGGVGERVAA